MKNDNLTSDLQVTVGKGDTLGQLGQISYILWSFLRVQVNPS